MSKIDSVPELRFSEFSEDWEVKKLGEVVKINQGLQIAISERFTEQSEGSYFYVTNEFLKPNSDKKFYIKNPSKSVLCNKEDILMTRTGNTGMVVTNVEGAFHNNFFKVAYPKYINKIYLYNFLLLKNTQAQILKMAGTSTIPDLNHSDFYRIKITFPILLEQQKIGSFLMAIDEKIQAFKKKKSLLEQYKKGLMQQIFSQQIRFKDEDGKDFPEWEKRVLCNLLEFHSTNSYSRSLLNYREGIAKNIHYGDIHKKLKSSFDVNKETVPFINMDINLGRIKEEQFLREGDLLIADASEDYKDIGKSIEIINTNGEKILGGLHTILGRDKKKMAIGFKGYLMQSYNVRNQIMKLATGISVLGISKSNLSKAEIGLPCYNEQNKIAAFLSAIDDKIQHCEKQIGKMVEWKEGLLQKMFV